MIENFDFTVISVTIIVVLGLIYGSKTFLGHQSTSSKALRSKMKEMEEYTVFLKKQVQTYKNKVSNAERGPQIEGSVDELGELVPDLVGQFADYLPKWAQPFAKDPEMQKWILNYIQEHPDKAKTWFSKMVGKKVAPKEAEESTMSI